MSIKGKASAMVHCARWWVLAAGGQEAHSLDLPLSRGPGADKGCLSRR